MIGVFGKLFSTFAFIALCIASVGLYAVIAQATVRRTQEIGIRMALGATSSRILTMVLSRGALQLAIGLALGLAAAFPVARLMNSVPLHSSVTDPRLFLVVASLLTMVGLFARWLPARRAAAVDPMVALRDE
jgi:ABC-type antimicrobial peptide transport system permease subunit